MKVSAGRQVANRKEATWLALQAARVEGMSGDVIDMFTSLAGTDKISGEAEKIIGTAIRNTYGGKATWGADRWLIPVPKLHYQGKDIPQLIIEITVYVIAVARVKTNQDSRMVTLAGAVGKAEAMAIPMVFLDAMLEEDLGRFAIIERDSIYTTWEVPGAGPVRLPNDFVSNLEKMRGYQSVVTWIEKFGDHGRVIAPLVAGSLLGLMFQDSSRSLPMNMEMATTDNLVNALESMAYKPAEARDMVRRAAPRLRSDMTLEEAIRITLQMGKGGN